jgi:hypothetical protein
MTNSDTIGTSFTKLDCENNNIVSFNMKYEEDTIIKNRNINISLGYYPIIVSAYADCSYGNWARMSKKSYIKFYVYAVSTDTSNGDQATLVYTDTNNYNFDSTDTNWKGYDASGNKFSETNYDSKTRYYSYTIKPYDIYLNNNACNIIKTMYSNLKSTSKSLIIYVVPKIYIEMYSNNKNCFKNIWFGGLMPKNVQYKTNLSSVICRDSKYEDQIGNLKPNATSPYYIVETLQYVKQKMNSVNSDDIGSICKDGIIFQKR